MTTKYEQCRYLRRSGERCTGEALDPNMPTLLCGKHLAAALRHAREAHARYRKESARA